MRIRILDAVDCEVESTAAERKVLKDSLSYKAVFYRRSQFGKKREEYRKSLLVKPKGSPARFPTGLLPRARASLAKHGVSQEIIGEPDPPPKTVPFSLPGTTLREDQARLVTAALEKRRGLLVSPTGSGKTIILAAFLSAFPRGTFLVVTHSTPILSQTASELARFGFPGVEKLGPAGSTPIPATGANALNSYESRIILATRQSLVGKDKDPETGKAGPPRIKEPHGELLGALDGVIVDEAHIWGGEDSQYTTIMRNTLAPYRIGLTATEPPDEAVSLILEGYLGPKIGELTHEEAEESGILSGVKLELVPVPHRSSISMHRGYEDLHRFGIVENRGRNHLILDKAAELVERGLTVLIFITQLDHADRLLDMAEVMGLEVGYIDGSVDGEERDDTKARLSNGDLRCVISSKAWREGVNIPSLGSVILAGGGKAELSTLQSIGRGLRKWEGKGEAVIVDFLDPYHYLAGHAIQRLQVYAERGWL